MDGLLHFLQLDSFRYADLLVVLVLIILEGLLSCDNAVVLALLVKDLPPHLRGKALRYGIIGAYVFRIAALLLATWIMSKWYLKVAGGAYLLWIAIKELRESGHGAGDASDGGGGAGGDGAAPPPRRYLGLSPFWSTVVAVELTDIVFSVDSIAAAVALSDKLWVLIVGGLLGILAMRFAAQGFVTLLERFPDLERAAFIAVAVIGAKLLLELPADVVGRQHRMPEGVAYASALEYEQAVSARFPPLFEIPHTLTINSAAAPPPDAAVLRQGMAAQLAAASVPTPPSAADSRAATPDEAFAREWRHAQAAWSLKMRPFIEIEGWASSLVVFAIFITGFLRRSPKAADGPASAP